MSSKKVGAGVGVILLKNHKVLLGKRHSDPEKADSELLGQGTWTLPGGKLDFLESLEIAACREVFEETGIKLNLDKLEFTSVSNDMIETAHFITIGFLCTEFSGEPAVMEPDEITEWQWFELDKLPEPMFFPSKRILKNFMEKRYYQKW
ncbi:MAG: NUDIX domain-containing protein [Candidatus Altiarchaeota archaeon]|nr:NUDIX domain-containing protein [Candidatus Altiarchaeota archaeon]